ncbi:MAG TPA: TraR/DksA C4-type zinc finger protein [Actinotalea sp.]
MSSALGPDAPGSPGEVLRLARAEAVARVGALAGAFGDLVEASAGSNADDEHDPEGTTIAFERSQLDALLHQARERVVEIEAALDRIATGRYGRCEVCGEPIAQARLEARPTARTCVACAAR